MTSAFPGLCLYVDKVKMADQQTVVTAGASFEFGLALGREMQCNDSSSFLPNTYTSGTGSEVMSRISVPWLGVIPGQS